MKILLLGGYGQTGRALSRHLLRQTEHTLIIAGRHGDKAREFAASLADARATPLQLDARDQASLRSALDGVNLVLVASPTSDSCESVVDAVLDARADYLDVQLSEPKLEILRNCEREMKDRGLCFVTEAGFHPGLPAALVRYAAAKIDQLEVGITACYLNMHGGVPYTDAVDELTEFFLHYRSEILSGGRWTNPGSYAVRKCDFGLGIGRRSCYSMFLEELRCLPELIPTLKETGLYISSTGWMLDAATMLLFLALKGSPQAARRRLGRLIWWSMMNLGAPPYGVVLQVEGTGLTDGTSRRLLTRLAHPDGYEFTAIPVVAFLKQYGEVRTAGLHLMGHLCDPIRLVADMQQMGIKATEVLE